MKAIRLRRTVVEGRRVVAVEERCNNEEWEMRHHAPIHLDETASSTVSVKIVDLINSFLEKDSGYQLVSCDQDAHEWKED